MRKKPIAVQEILSGTAAAGDRGYKGDFRGSPRLQRNPRREFTRRRDE